LPFTNYAVNVISKNLKIQIKFTLGKFNFKYIYIIIMSQNNRNRLITNRDIHILNTNIIPFFKEDMKIINEYREIVLNFNGLLQDKYNFDLNVSELPYIEINYKRLTEKFTDEYIKNEYLRYFIEIRELTPL